MGTGAGHGARLWGCLMAQREDRALLAWGLLAVTSLSASISSMGVLYPFSPPLFKV